MHDKSSRSFLLGICLLLSACSSSTGTNQNARNPWGEVSDSGPGYVFVEIDEFTGDQESWVRYQQEAAPTLATHQARGLVATAEVKRLEGESSDAWTVGLQFSDAASARGWYDDPDYESARPHRHRAVANTDMALFRGYAVSAETIDNLDAFLLFSIKTIRDDEEFRDYQLQLAPLLERHGGVALAVGAPEQTFEGVWDEDFTLFAGFPSLDAISAWDEDPDYQQLKLRAEEFSSGVSSVAVKAFDPADFQ